MSVAARGSFLHLAWCHDSKSTARVTDEDADHSFQMPPGTSAVTTYHLTTGAAVGTAPLPSLPPARDSVLRREEDVGDDHARGRKGDEEARDGSGKTRGGVVTIEAGGGSAPDVLVCAVETGGSGGLYRLATRVPPALAASIATQLPDGSGRVPDDSAEVRRRHRTLTALADECASWGGSADGARRVASLAIAELEASAAARGVALIDDDSGSNLGVKPGGSLRAALLLREKDSVIADVDSWRSAAVKCVEFAKASSSTFEGYSPADVRVIEGALRADDDDVQSIHRTLPPNTTTPSSEAEEVSESKWKRLGTPGMARRVDPEEVEDMTWYALDDELPVYADLRVGAAVLASAEAAARADQSTEEFHRKCVNALHLAAKAARKRDEPTAALSTGRMFDNHAAETVADLSDASFDGHTPVRDGDEFDVAFRKSIDFIVRRDGPSRR